MPAITVCICTFNRYEYLHKSISSLLDQSLSDYNIIVLDNSIDQVVAEQEAQKYKDTSNLKYIVKHTNGLSHAKNICMEICETEYIHYVDDDIIASRDLLENIVTCFKKYNCSVVGGKVIPLYETPVPEWFTQNCLDNVSCIDWGERPLRIQPMKCGRWLVGANTGYRLSDLKKYNGFNQDLGRKGKSFSLLSNEELHLHLRMAKDNNNIMYCPGAILEHCIPAHRMEKNWHIKRAVWQIISDNLTGIQWPSTEASVKILKENIHLIFDGSISDEVQFGKQINIIKMLTSFILSDNIPPSHDDKLQN